MDAERLWLEASHWQAICTALATAISTGSELEGLETIRARIATVSWAAEDYEMLEVKNWRNQ